MIEGAERDGLLSPGDAVVEYTGGSTGPSLALVRRAEGYRALIVMADCSTEEGFQLLRALGAEVDVVPSVEGRPRVTSQDIENMVARAASSPGGPGTNGALAPVVDLQEAASLHGKGPGVRDSRSLGAEMGSPAFFLAAARSTATTGA
jgi:cysteine synthase